MKDRAIEDQATQDEQKPSAERMPKSLERLRDKLRVKRYSVRAERSYVDWSRRFILFHGKRQPRELEAQAMETFLTHLAVDRNVSASTQNQANSALLFFYREVLDIDLPWLAR